ncbi:cupin domain-containing protein [Haloferax namakaokahaiae]|uniref:Cupin domain-containing protein n=1 Tax=Haloferax namakaokahaiae TaxID=1748331 RepID=A0ABD5ZK54_9EURY
MRKHVNLNEMELYDADVTRGKLLPVGYELRPQQMRPSVWVYEAGGHGTKHKQKEQEELYHVLSGRFELVFADETMELEPGSFVVVSPDEERQLHCLEDGKVFVVGAPNVKDDGVVLD